MELWLLMKFVYLEIVLLRIPSKCADELNRECVYNIYTCVKV